jgi:hypothetical protein
MKAPKTREEREREVAKLSEEVKSLGIPEDDMQPLFDVLDRFATEGEGYSGVVKLPQFNLAFVVKLSLQAHVHSGMRLTSLSALGARPAPSGKRQLPKPTKSQQAAQEEKAKAAADARTPANSAAKTESQP